MKRHGLETIGEIAIRDKLPLVEVINIYTRFSTRVYTRALFKRENHELYNSILEKEIFELVERYFDIKKVKRRIYK